MKISRLGEAPDYRFSLANERTFLAWIRTALGFLAAGVGLDQLAPDFATPLIREVLALLLCLFAGVRAIYGYRRWLRNEKAMRLKQDLRYTRLPSPSSTTGIAQACHSGSHWSCWRLWRSFCGAIPAVAT